MRTSAEAGRGRRWVIVLAGGEGLRMMPFITSWLGEHRPKQYCAFAGEKTMLEHTMERALDLADPSRIITVIGRGHWQYLDAPRRLSLPGRIVEQPANRDTAPGLFLPLSYIMAEDPDAVVAVLPSDHFVRPRERFAHALERAYALAGRLDERIVLLAAEPDRAETDYGWLEPGGPVSAFALSARAVARFHEKPVIEAARAFLDRGWLWNTMIMAGRASAFWRLGQRRAPNLMARFEAIRESIDWGDCGRVLVEAYAGMESLNFSSGLLERVPESAAILPLSGVDWCDWGRPERIIDCLKTLGKEPSFLQSTLAAA